MKTASPTCAQDGPHGPAYNCGTGAVHSQKRPLNQGQRWAGKKLLKPIAPALNLILPRLVWAWRLGRRRCPALFTPCCSSEDVAMRTYDFSPLYRSTVGFDRLFDLLDHAGRVEPNWPPYDIEKLGETEYRITMAVAGFAPDEIELVQKENTLFVAGQKRGAE